MAEASNEQVKPAEPAGAARLYLDVEFNGHGGELISLALAAEDGKHWYGLWPVRYSLELDPWVAQHVIPIRFALQPTAIFEARDEFRASLREYLLSRSGCTIYADWPGDFAHLMQIMSGPSYEQSWTVPCSMTLLAESEPKPEIPHNALSDAIALMEWHTCPRALVPRACANAPSIDEHQHADPP